MPRRTQVQPHRSLTSFAYGTLTPSGCPFQGHSAIRQVSYSLKVSQYLPRLSSYPSSATAVTFSTLLVWAPPRSLAATRRIFSTPLGTEMFQFPRCPPSHLLYRSIFQCPVPVVPTDGFPHSDIQVSSRVLTTPPGFSQPATSFFGTRRLGIHPAPFFASSMRIANKYLCFPVQL